MQMQAQDTQVTHKDIETQIKEMFKKEQTKATSSTTGKIMGATGMGVFTGGLLTLALKLVKNADALGSPVSYVILASGLLLSLYDIVNKTLGSEYASTANFTALTTLISWGSYIVTHE
jgi:hypothetical protein